MSESKNVLVQGRIVWINGDLFTGDPEKIYKTTTPKINPKTGKQETVFRFGLAVSKAELADPTKGAIWMTMHQTVREAYPSGNVPTNFAWKFKDGDSQGTDDEGKVIDYSKKEGYPGALVFTLSTNIQPRFFRWENGQNIQIMDGIKCGDYVNIQVNIDSQQSGKPGLYLNPMAVQLVAAGKEIISAPSADQVFGVSAPQAPAGYVPPPQPTMPAMAPPPGMPLPAQPAPHWGVLPPAHQPPPGGQPMGNGAPAGMFPQPGYQPPVISHGGPMSPGPTAPMNAYPSNGMPPIPR